MPHTLKSRILLAACLCLASASAVAQEKISDEVVKIGAILDMSGPYADLTGEGTATAIRMAVQDVGGKVAGRPVEVLVADHQNKPDIAANKAREWFDREKLDALMDVAASAPALAVVEIAKAKNRVLMLNGPGTTRLTNENCSPVTVHYTFDTYAQAHGTGAAVLKQGGDTWYFVSVDYAFGHSLESDTGEVVRAAGGKVLGAVRHPLGTQDFSSFLLQAQSSGARVIGVANAGADLISTVRAANEFGITQSGKQQLAGLLVFINDVHALGLKVAQGLLLTEAFYWDQNEATRKWSQRFFDKMHKMPNSIQAGVYSSTLHYLRAVEKAGTDETGAVMAAMRAQPVNDFFAKNGKIREDGRMVHDMYLYQVKKPSESSKPWDYYKLVSVIPADQAFRPLAQSTCSLVR